MSQGSTTAVKLAEMQIRIVKPLGQGAGSSVFQIADQKKGGYYALKIVKKSDADDEIYIAQALQEAEVGPKLNHPSLMKIYDHRVKRNWMMKVASVELLMEYIDGRTLDELEIRERGQLVLMFLNVASALNHMHRRGVYHGDLKPGNIMLSKDGAVKVIDFGTAWMKGQEKNRVQGTLQFMAPEQAREKVVNDKTDLFNLGATMYRMFTGHYANAGMPGDDDGAIGPRGKIRPPIKLDSKFPRALNDLIMCCLQPSPEARPAGAYEAENQLKAVAKQLGLKIDDLRGIEAEAEEASWDDEV